MSLLVALALARTTLGGWDQWAAFRDDAPARCYAIAAPVRRGPSRWEPFASIATWPRAGVRLQLHARLSRQVAPGSDTTASVGALRIPLVTNGVDAWTRGGRDDAALATAMRGGRNLNISGIALNGARFTDTYVLAGAATALDAATLACAR